MLDTGVAVNGAVYTPLSKHRGLATASRSVWIVSVRDEIQCFVMAFRERWVFDTDGWGLRPLSPGRLQVLGVNGFKERLALAKFVGADGSWHGYPADYRRRVQDRPPMHLLRTWRASEILRKHQMAKISSGKQCNL
jgi:hypothetical protein